MPIVQPMAHIVPAVTGEDHEQASVQQNREGPSLDEEVRMSGVAGTPVRSETKSGVQHPARLSHVPAYVPVAACRWNWRPCCVKSKRLLSVRQRESASRGSKRSRKPTGQGWPLVEISRPRSLWMSREVPPSYECRGKPGVQNDLLQSELTYM